MAHLPLLLELDRFAVRYSCCRTRISRRSMRLLNGTGKRHPEVRAFLARLEGWAAGTCVASILRGSPKRLAPQDDGGARIATIQRVFGSTAGSIVCTAPDLRT